jgi:hypothetical protein
VSHAQGVSHKYRGLMPFGEGEPTPAFPEASSAAKLTSCRLDARRHVAPFDALVGVDELLEGGPCAG